VRKLVITLFCIALLIPSRGNTLGLGEIELHSSLNEELNAEIVLTSVGQESAETIIVKLASRKDFDRAGIDRPFILNDLKFAVKIKNGQPIIAVTSKKAIREPFLSFLIDIDWPRGHILREFTMLLDPPVFMQATPEGVPTKTVVSPQSNNVDTQQNLERPGYSTVDTRNSQASAPGAPVANAQQQYQAPLATTQSRPLTSAQIARSYQIPSDAYRVQKGDTAWKIAEKLRADNSVSIEQMMMALLRRNPEAFIKDNINGVKRGYILRMPSQQEVQSLDNQTALLQVKEQYALWREYRQARIAKRTGNKIDRAGSSEGTSKSDQDAGQGRLTIASAAEKEGSMGMTSGSQNPEAELKQLRKDLAATTEELESGKLENSELKDRLTSLQTRMKKMERLLNLKDGDLAKLQSDLDPIADNTAPATPEMAAETAEMSPAAVDMTTEESTEAAGTEAMLPPGTEPEVADMTASDDAAEMDAISSTQPAEDAVFKDEMDAMQTAPQQPAAVPQLPPADIGQKPESGDLLTDLLNDPDSLPLIVGIPVSIMVLVAIIALRRKKARKSEEVVSSLPETGDFNFDEVADLVGDEGDFNDAEEQDLSDKLDAFAEEAEAEAEMDFDDAAEDVISLDEDQPAEEAAKDDVLAEADVYLAYGIYQQAEELLKTAVAENPDRDDYKVKLLETYFASKDKSSFNSLAEGLKESINTESPDWQRVVAMGRELDSGNALFNDSGDVPNFDVDDLLPQKPETDFDLGDAAADFDLGNSIDEGSDFDLGLDDESLDDEIDATVALSAEEASSFDLGGSIDEGADNFALNDDGLDELDQELAEAGIDDLADEMEFGLDEVEAAPEAEAPAEDIDDNFSLDFEMADLGLDESDAEVSVEETEAIASSLEPETEDMGLDLAAGDDIPDMPEASDDLEMDLGDLGSDDVSLDMGDIDLGDIDLSADLTDDAGQAEDAISLDMGDIGDIDLSADDDDATIVRSMTEEDDEPIDISSLPDDLDEVNTKLDLARAYIDMGDSDGASDILREVIEEAAGDQKATAEELLKNIA